MPITWIETLNASSTPAEGAGNEDNEKQSVLYVFDLLAVRITLLAVYSIVFTFCFFGNLAVVVVTTFHRKMRSTTKFFLGHLAIANFCVAVLCIYQHLSVYLAQTRIFGELLCKMYHFVISLSHTASVFILLVTAVERCCMIVHPFRSRWLFTRGRNHAIIFLVWLLSSVLSFHKFYYVTLIEHTLTDTGTKEVICAMDVTYFNHKLADMVSFVLLFLAPLVVITVLYTRIGVFLHKQEQRWALRENLSVNKNMKTRREPSTAKFRRTDVIVKCNSQSRVLTCIHRRRKRHAVKVLVTIAISFALCNFPFHVGKILQNYFEFYESDNRWLELVAPLTFLFTCVNSAINPFLHALFKRDFQRCLFQLLCCKHRKEREITRSFRSFV